MSETITKRPTDAELVMLLREAQCMIRYMTQMLTKYKPENDYQYNDPKFERQLLATADALEANPSTHR